jgi:ATP-binding cassette subfamily B multidrug efflux pump
LQTTMSRTQTRGRRGDPKTRGSMGRAIRYLFNYKGQAALPYLFLIIATLSQLAVPRLVRNVIDAVTSGYIGDQVLKALDQIPAQLVSTALPKMLELIGKPSTLTLEQLRTQLESDVASAPQTLISAILFILLFAALRGIFSFLQAYWAEKNSQAVAYDMRNDLYAKIQRLSFSYHDKNQTGQLMIRATDDVEKVRVFIGQGLLQLVGAIILLTGTLIILFTCFYHTAHPSGCLCFVYDLRRVESAFVCKGTAKTFHAEHDPAGKSCGREGDQGLYA